MPPPSIHHENSSVCRLLDLFLVELLFFSYADYQDLAAIHQRGSQICTKSR